MTPDEVMAWVGAYEEAWRAADVSAVDRLFAESARYARSPYDQAPLHGREQIEGFWLDDGTFTMSAELFAVSGRRAVVRVVVRYDPPSGQEYTDLWLLRFAADGRVEDFEEWAYWPGLHYTASAAEE